jgi:DNA-binding MarR family transcriptional regulator
LRPDEVRVGPVEVGMTMALRSEVPDGPPPAPLEGGLDPELGELAELLLRTTPQTAVMIRRTVRGFTRAERTLLQFRVLHRLWDGPCTTGELAGVNGASAAAVSKVVALLVEDGLVARRHDPRDRRYVRLSLTPRGRDHVDAMLRAARQGIARRLRALAADERATLRAGLEVLRRCIAGAALGPAATPCGEEERCA